MTDGGGARDADLPVITSAAVLVETIHPKINPAAAVASWEVWTCRCLNPPPGPAMDRGIPLLGSLN